MIYELPWVLLATECHYYVCFHMHIFINQSILFIDTRSCQSDLI